MRFKADWKFPSHRTEDRYTISIYHTKDSQTSLHLTDGTKTPPPPPPHPVEWSQTDNLHLTEWKQTNFRTAVWRQTDRQVSNQRSEQTDKSPPKGVKTDTSPPREVKTDKSPPSGVKTDKSPLSRVRRGLQLPKASQELFLHTSGSGLVPGHWPRCLPRCLPTCLPAIMALAQLLPPAFIELPPLHTTSRTASNSHSPVYAQFQPRRHLRITV